MNDKLGEKISAQVQEAKTYFDIIWTQLNKKRLAMLGLRFVHCLPVRLSLGDNSNTPVLGKAGKISSYTGVLVSDVLSSIISTRPHLIEVIDRYEIRLEVRDRVKPVEIVLKILNGEGSRPRILHDQSGSGHVEELLSPLLGLERLGLDFLAVHLRDAPQHTLDHTKVLELNRQQQHVPTFLRRGDRVIH